MKTREQIIKKLETVRNELADLMIIEQSLIDVLNKYDYIDKIDDRIITFLTSR